MEWFQFGIHLGIPHHELSIIKADYQDVRSCKSEMLQWWLKNSPGAKWSTIVQALVKAGMKGLAHTIALKHGMVNVTCTPCIHPSNTILLLAGMSLADCISVSEAAATVEPSPNTVCGYYGKHVHLTI